MDYVLKSKDKSVLSFSIDKEVELVDDIQDISYQLKVNSVEDASLLPISVEPTDTSVSAWLMQRKIPYNRIYSDELLNLLPDMENPYNYIDSTYALSLNDTYWVCPAEQKIYWQDINPYDNPLNDVIADIAFTGFIPNELPSGTMISPEYTTNGMLKKCWHREGNDIYLVKGSTPRYANGGQEAILEVYAAQIAKQLGLPHVEYSVRTYKGELASICKLFTSQAIGYIPIFVLTKDMRLTRNSLSRYKTQLQIGTVYGMEQFEDMMVLDALIHNTDRHLGNFGVLIDNDSNRILGPAPFFDHGNSLFHSAIDEDYDDLPAHAKLFSYWGISFDRQAELYLKERHTPMLRELENFKFDRIKSDIVDAKKVDALERYIQNRAAYFIELLERKSGGDNSPRG